MLFSKFHLKKDWGRLFFLLFTLGTLISVSVKNPAGHYHIFVSGANALWNGELPYGDDFGTRSGWYFYSPSCGLFFFQLFNFFPEKLGQFIYLTLSLVVLLIGLDKVLITLRDRFGFNLLKAKYQNLFWLMITSELNGAILATKVEIIMLGAIFLAWSWLLRNTHTVGAALLLGIITNWKFQPLPIVGLIAIVLWWAQRDWRFISIFVSTTAFMSLLPYAVQPASFITECYTAWQSTLSQFIARDWMGYVFHHIFAFAQKTLGWATPLPTAQFISVVVGGSLALALWLWLNQLNKKRGKDETTQLGLLAAFALGSAFIVLFSPLSQSTGYLMYYPLLITFYFISWQNQSQSYAWLALLLVIYFLISISVSDLTPKPLRHWFYGHSFKALGSTLLTLLFGYQMLKLNQIRVSLKTGVFSKAYQN